MVRGVLHRRYLFCLYLDVDFYSCIVVGMKCLMGRAGRVFSLMNVFERIVQKKIASFSASDTRSENSIPHIHSLKQGKGALVELKHLYR